jgi:hypothetical protein
MGMKAVSDHSKAVFATFTKALSIARQVGLDSAAKQGQARYNNNMGCAHEYLVTGRKGKTKKDTPSAVKGLFHQFLEEFTDLLIVTGQRQSNATHKDFNKL